MYLKSKEQETKSYNKHYINIISILDKLFSVLLSYYCVLGNSFQAIVFNEVFLQRKYFFFEFVYKVIDLNYSNSDVVSIWILIQTELFPLSEQRTKMYAQEKSFFS